MHLLLGGVIFGILAAHSYGRNYEGALVSLSLFSVIALRALLTKTSLQTKMLLKRAAIVLLGFSTGAALAVYYSHMYTVKQNNLMQCRDVCTFNAMVVARPETSERGYRYEMKLLSMNEKTLYGTYAVVEMPKVYTFMYGDTLSFESRVYPFRAFQSDTGRVVAYDKIMQSKNIHISLRAATVQLTGHVSSLTRLSVYSTDMFIGAVAVALPEPAAGLAQGITYGMKGALDEESETLFRVTGLSHITVFSGSNVAMFLAAVWFLTASFPYSARVLISLSALCALLVGIGINPPTLRAGLMGAVYVVARAAGKSVSGLSILSFSVLCMLLFQPASIMYDLSFQLSVLAVIALMTIAQPIEAFLADYVPRAIAALIAMTFSVLLVVAPWVAYIFGTFSMSSFFANILVVPLVPAALVLAVLCASSVVIAPALTPLIAYPTELLYMSIFKIAELCAALPYSSLQLPLFHGVYICIWYAMLALWYMRTTQKKERELRHTRLDD